MRHAVAPGPMLVVVEITAMARNGSVRIEVKDNGPGLSPNLTRWCAILEELGSQTLKLDSPVFMVLTARFELT